MSLAKEIKKRGMKKVVGKKHGLDEAPCKSRRELPTFEITAKDLPQIKNWKVGETYKLALEVEQTSLRKGGYFGDQNNQELEARFKIKKIAAVEDSNIKRLAKKFS